MTREAYLARHPEHLSVLPEDLGTKALLIGPGGSFTLPLNKVQRSVMDGPEHNLTFYARAQSEEFGSPDQGSRGPAKPAAKKKPAKKKPATKKPATKKKPSPAKKPPAKKKLAPKKR